MSASNGNGATKINVTKNYKLFSRCEENRPVNLKKHRPLEMSMKEYGFLRSFPISCRRDSNKALVVKDGQHRLAIAETLGLPVYWVEDPVDFDIAKVNNGQEKWQVRDFAEKFAANGIASYREGMEFADRHGLPIGTAFALLSGYTSFTGCKDEFVAGKFMVKDRKWADNVAAIYVPLTTMAPVMRNARFIEACMAVCRVAGFDAKRLLQNAERCREKLVAYSTREAYMDMLEAIYNFGRAKLVGLKAEATMLMRERSPIKPKAAKKA